MGAQISVRLSIYNSRISANQREKDMTSQCCPNTRKSEQSQRTKSASYTKPELVYTGPAVSQIQGVDKQSQFLETALIKHATPAAYEADE